MPTYNAPVRELRFVLNELLAITECTEIPGYGDVSADLVDAVLDGGAKITEEIWAPLNQVGDEEGCRFENGKVRTPAGFREAFEAFYDGGWNAISTYLRGAVGRGGQRPDVHRAGAFEAALRAEDDVGRMDRHHEPDRAALRY